MFFKISLAEWSLHQELQAGKISHLDFPIIAAKDFDIHAVEYVNQFFMDKAENTAYLSELKSICTDNDVTSLLIMIDHEGFLADPDSALRQKAVENHFKWVDAAAYLECHSIRVNCFGSGTAEEMSQRCSESLRKIAEYAKPSGVNVIVENHGGFSSDANWLTNVIRNTGMDNCGLLPDFGNFCTRRELGDMWDSPCLAWFDRYAGVEQMMPFAKGVSAKAMVFDENDNCVETDYFKMLPIVKSGGYTGYIGVEYEGKGLSEAEGIRKTKGLLERAGRAME